MSELNVFKQMLSVFRISTMIENSLPSYKILNRSTWSVRSLQMKNYIGDKLKFLNARLDHNVGKRENVTSFPTMFSKAFSTKVIKDGLVEGSEKIVFEPTINTM